MKKNLLLATIAFCSLLFVNKANAQCEAAAGVPVPPLTEFDQCTQDMAALTVAEFMVQPGGTTNFDFAVTYIHPDSTELSTFDAPIVGVTSDGQFDFCGQPLGQYCFHGFSYNQAELDTITSNETIQGLASCLKGGETLDSILICIGSLPIFDYATINGAIVSVLGEIVPGAVPAFNPDLGNEPPCFDVVPEGMEYCIDVTCSDETSMCLLLDVQQYYNDTFGVSNAPNPFNINTIINYTTQISGLVDFKVYNSTGALVHQENLKSIAGKNNFEFNRGNLQSGVYYYTIGNKQAATPGKMIIK